MVGKIVFLFPGQGSQAVGMAKAAFEAASSVRKIFEEADDLLGFPLSKIMFEGPEEKLQQTEVAQPALFLASAAALELLKERHLRPAFTAGHSLGEYSALYASGVLSLADALNLVRARGQAMREAGQLNPGTMAAVIGLDPVRLDQICRDVTATGKICVTANFNSESQIVISGTKDGVNEAMEKASAAGAMKVVPLKVSGAFHSPLMDSAIEKMRPLIESTQFSDTTIPVVTNVDALPTTQGPEFKKKLLQQINHSVLWHDTMKKLLGENPELCVEVGSGKVLSTLLKKLDRKKFVFCTDEIEQLDKHLSVLSAQH